MLPDEGAKQNFGADEFDWYETARPEISVSPERSGINGVAQDEPHDCRFQRGKSKKEEETKLIDRLLHHISFGFSTSLLSFACLASAASFASC